MAAIGKKFNKKKKAGGKRGSFKKSKPNKKFQTTKRDVSKRQKKDKSVSSPNELPEISNAATSEQQHNTPLTTEKKFKKDKFFVFKKKLNSTEAEKQDTIKVLEDKIKTLESRGQLTNTAIRKLRQLKKLKATAEGGVEKKATAEGGVEKKPPPPKTSNPVSKSAKRRERRKLALATKIDAKEHENTQKVAKRKKTESKKEDEQSTVEDDTITKDPTSDQEQEEHANEDENEEKSD